MNPAFVYERRLQRAVARLSETVSLSRSGVTVTTQPLIVPSTAAIQTVVAQGASTTPTTQEQYTAFSAQTLAGDTTAPSAATASASTTTKITVVPTLLIVQDVFQSPCQVGDTFTRDSQTWTVRKVANQLIAGQIIAVLSLADTPPPAS